MVYRVVDWVEYGWVADELVITLPNGDMVILNKSAAVALGALKNARTNQEEEIAKALADEFGLTPNHAVRDARAALAKLRGQVLSVLFTGWRQQRKYLTSVSRGGLL